MVRLLFLLLFLLLTLAKVPSAFAENCDSLKVTVQEASIDLLQDGTVSSQIISITESAVAQNISDCSAEAQEQIGKALSDLKEGAE